MIWSTAFLPDRPTAKDIMYSELRIEIYPKNTDL